MDINILEEILKISKELKAAYVYIENDYIYGVDKEFVYIKYMKFDNVYHVNISFEVLQMSKFIKEVGFNNIKLINDSTSLYSSFDNIINIYNMDLITKIKNIVCNINNTMNTSIITVKDESMKDIESFDYILNCKSADGSIVVNYSNKYAITIFKNMIPIKKSDKVYITIYDVNNNQFLVRYSTVRKKVTIETVIMYLHM